MKNFMCNLCGFEFSKGRDLIRHMRVHTGERPFKCIVDDCGRSFKLAANLKRHTKFKHSAERPFKCDFPDCLYTAKTFSNLLNHKKLHNAEIPFACPCDGCSFRAKFKSGITKHIKSAHSAAKTFACVQCEFKTAQRGYFKRHMSLHSARRDFKCNHPQCTSSFKIPSKLKSHFRYFHEGKNLQCNNVGCGRYLRTKKTLKNHLKLHNPSGRRFQCPFCLKHFTNFHYLQDHCVVHTSEKPFQCGHCDFAAARRTDAKRHISSVHASIVFPYIVHLPDDRECISCKVILQSAQFLIHSITHAVPLVMIERLQTRQS